MIPKFKVNLKPIHDQQDLSPYAIAKKTGLSKNTILKYVACEDVITERLESALLILFRFYGVNWCEPGIIEIVEQ